MCEPPFQWILGEAVDGQARVYVQACSESNVVEIRGRLRGPFSEFARTLPAEFVLQSAPSQSNAVALASTMVPDPCFWTPELPMQYQLDLEIIDDQGRLSKTSRWVGLRRWSADGCHLRLERRRTVLRAVRDEQISVEQLPATRSACIALLVSQPSESLCAAACEQGVPLIADLTQSGKNLFSELAKLDWFPAVMMVLVEAKQLHQIRRSQSPPHQLLLAHQLGVGAKPTAVEMSACDALAVVLTDNERPPDWLATCEKPVVAIRRGKTYADWTAARHGCDVLQAELAPQFDLAGYFV